MIDFKRSFAKVAYLVGKAGNLSDPEDYLYKPDFEPASACAQNEISVRWLGAAAYRFEYHGEALWIDPYFSRHSFKEMISGPLKPKPDEIDRYMDRADWIAIGHSHYDHAADLPYIVPKTGATVIGSRSVGNLFDAYKFPRGQLVEVTGGDTVDAGPFKVSFIESRHGAVFGRIPNARDISPRAKAPLRMKDYGSGEVFNIIIEADGYRIYHQGSGGIVEEMLRGCRAEMAIIGISSRKATPRMVYRVVKELKPRVVIPTHYDQFFWPLDNGMILVPGLNFREVVRETGEAAPEAELITLPLCGEYRVKIK